MSKRDPKPSDPDDLVRTGRMLLDQLPEPERVRGLSAGIGATLGAVLGSVVGGPVGAAVGGAVGAALGVAAGEKTKKEGPR